MLQTEISGKYTLPLATLVTRRRLELKCVPQLFLGLLLVTPRFARPVWHAGHADREASCIGFGVPGMPGMKLV